MRDQLPELSMLFFLVTHESHLITYSFPLKEFIERCLEHDPIRRANVEELLSRLGLPEPDKQDETSLDEDGFLDDQRNQDTAHSSLEPTHVVIPERAVSSPPQEPAPNIDRYKAIPTAANTHKQTAANIASNTKQDGYNIHFTTITPITTTTNSTAVSAAEAVVLTTAATSTVTTNTLLNPQNTSIQDEGYHTNQSIGEAPGQTNDTSISEKSSVSQHQQHQETRLITQMHAEVLEQGGGYHLRIQLQLDDQMNRQLTAPLKEEDTAETLSEELVQHGFVSESNSLKVRELLDSIISEYRLRKLKKNRSLTVWDIIYMYFFVISIDLLPNHNCKDVIRSRISGAL
uniref:Uncharacterized protein n=1 Tax=Meloidogyne enterolobii TaxID=390850 RepID=A0A6V7XSL9_MELEN|nr:unnamed protein product [Meloidogyne enterolobii]